MTSMLNTLRRSLPAPRCLVLMLTGAALLIIGILGAVRAQANWNASEVATWLAELKPARYALVIGADLPLELIADRVRQPEPTNGWWWPGWVPAAQKWGNDFNLVTTSARFRAAAQTTQTALCSHVTVRVSETLVGSSAAFGQALGGVPDQNIVRLRLGTPSAMRLDGIDAMHLITQLQPRKLAQGGQNPCR